jgi:hypothetical protein
MSKKFTVKTLKPRNPWVVASLRRVAGAHRVAKERQQGQRALRSELAHLERPQERHSH